MYAILRIKKLKTAANIQAALNHNNREAGAAPNANPKLSHLNTSMVRNNPIEWIKELFQKRNIKPRKDAVMAVEYLLTASPEFFEGKTAKELKDWEKANKKFLEQKHGKGNVLSFHVHRDESTMHIQAIIIPIKKEKKKFSLSAKHFFDRPKLRELQDEYANEMAQFGLKRGVARSAVKHQPISKFYGKLDKHLEKQSGQIKELEKDIETIGSIEKPSFFGAFKNFEKTQQVFQAAKRIVSRAVDMDKANHSLSMQLETIKQNEVFLKKQLSNAGASIEEKRELEKSLQTYIEYAEELKSESDIQKKRANDFEQKLKTEEAKNQELHKNNVKLQNKVNELEQSITNS